MEFATTEAHEIPLSLLLEADPSETSIEAYLSNAWCFTAQEHNQCVGACVFQPLSKTAAELCNISIKADRQAQGIGTQLLRYALKELAVRGIRQVELGTGTFGHQLAFYQRLGFRVESVVKNHFLDNYPDPIFENGIQHKDMLRLCLNL